MLASCVVIVLVVGIGVVVGIAAESAAATETVAHPAAAARTDQGQMIQFERPVAFSTVSIHAARSDGSKLSVLM